MDINDGFTISPPSTAKPKDRFDKADHEGTLLLFVAPDLLEDLETSYGFSDCVESAYIVVMDGDTAGDVHSEVRLWGSALVPAITEDESELVLGRLVKGDAKPGKNAPWLIQAPTPQDEKLATAWIDDAIKTGVLTRKTSGRIVIDTEKAPF